MAKKRCTDPHPMQPVYRDEDGKLRFKDNAIVRFLLDWSSRKGMSLNELVLIPFSQEDWDHFYQLIGYSLGGYDELSIISDEAKEKAESLSAPAWEGNDGK